MVDNEKPRRPKNSGETAEGDDGERRRRGNSRRDLKREMEKRKLIPHIRVS